MTTNNVQENLHIKLQFNDEFRRFNVPGHTKYAELLEKIKQILSLDKDFTVKYKDDENEWITISSDIELETGISFAKGSLLRLLVSVTTHKEGESTCPGEKWRARWRKRMEEGGDEGDCKKWRRNKWRKHYECDNEGDEGDCKKWRRRKWRKNDCENDKDVESGECKKWRGRGRDCKKWKDCDKEEGSDGDCGNKKKKYTDAEREEWLEQKRKRIQERKEKRQKWKKEEVEEETSQKESARDGDINSGDELLNLEQIKKEIETLKANAEKLREKKNESQQQLVAIRTQIKDKRKGGALDEVLNLRKLLKAKKEEKDALATELRKNFWRMKSLQKLAASKSE